jgi:hypothetical protein
MATKKENKKDDIVIDDIIDEVTPSGENKELSAIAVKSLTNIEEKIEAMDWKLWEIYNIIKNYVESAPVGSVAPQVQQPQPSSVDIAAEIAKQLQGNAQPEEKKSVVGKLFGK